MTGEEINYLHSAFGNAQDAMDDETFIRVQGIIGRIRRHTETERRQFAAMAMQGLVLYRSKDGDEPPPKVIARWSVQQADALIEALNEAKEKP